MIIKMHIFLAPKADKDLLDGARHYGSVYLHWILCTNFCWYLNYAYVVSLKAISVLFTDVFTMSLDFLLMPFQQYSVIKIKTNQEKVFQIITTQQTVFPALTFLYSSLVSGPVFFLYS